jgi:hypothetical protein
MGLESIQGTEVPTEDFDAKYSGSRDPKAGRGEALFPRNRNLEPAFGKVILRIQDEYL